MSQIVIERQTPSSTRLRFVWHGGPYIDIFWVGGEVPRHVDVHHEGQSSPFMNINVYDYGTGKPTISTEEEMAARVDEWIEEKSEDYGL